MGKRDRSWNVLFDLLFELLPSLERTRKSASRQCCACPGRQFGFIAVWMLSTDGVWFLLTTSSACAGALAGSSLPLCFLNALSSPAFASGLLLSVQQKSPTLSPVFQGQCEPFNNREKFSSLPSLDISPLPKGYKKIKSLLFTLIFFAQSRIQPLVLLQIQSGSHCIPLLLWKLSDHHKSCRDVWHFGDPG